MRGMVDPWERDWDEALAFFKDHAPLRYAAYDKMTEGQKRGLRPFITDLYSSFRPVANDSELKQLKIEQMGVEDKVYDLRTRLASAEDGSPSKTQLQDDLRKACEDLVDSRTKERHLRLDRLEKLLKDEQAHLLADEGNKKQMVDDLYSDVTRPDRGRGRGRGDAGLFNSAPMDGRGPGPRGRGQ